MRESILRIAKYRLQRIHYLKRPPGRVSKPSAICDRYGGQAVFSLISSSIFMAVWIRRSSKATRDEEEPLLGAPPNPHPRPSAAMLVLAAVAILLGGCISALCGLGGKTQEAYSAQHA